MKNTWSLINTNNTLVLWLGISFYCEKCLCTHSEHVIPVQGNKK